MINIFINSKSIISCDITDILLVLSLYITFAYFPPPPFLPSKPKSPCGGREGVKAKGRGEVNEAKGITAILPNE